MGTSKCLTTDVQPHSVPSFHKPGHTQEERRLLKINEEWDLSRCIALVGMCAKVSAFAAHELYFCSLNVAVMFYVCSAINKQAFSK